MSKEKDLFSKFLKVLNKYVKYMIPIALIFYKKLVLIFKYIKPIVVKYSVISFKFLKKLLLLLLLLLVLFVF